MDEKERLKQIISQWKIKADNDLTIIEQTIFNENPVTDVLCFHCQKAAEKYLKLFLVTNIVKPPKTHDIAILLEACKKIDESFIQLQDYIYLTDYAVEMRYPDEFIMPSKEDMFKAYDDAKHVRDFILKRIKD